MTTNAGCGKTRTVFVNGKIADENKVGNVGHDPAISNQLFQLEEQEAANLQSLVRKAVIVAYG